MRRVRIFPYKMGSKGASVLAEALRAANVRTIKIYPDRNYKPKPQDLVVNWGNGRVPQWDSINQFSSQGQGGRFDWDGGALNAPPFVAHASNKLHAFERLRDAGVSIPEFTTDKEVANGWIEKGSIVVGRESLTGHSGHGIRLYGGDFIHTLGDLPLYVRYIKKKAEFRVHVFRGEVIDVQQKRRRKGIEDVDKFIRSHDRGWVFCREDLDVPESVQSAAVSAINSLRLDFGAVDVIYNQHYNRAYVLEINTAPGLEGETVTKYVNKIKELV